jgi:HEPN domain-containing protein
MKAELLRVGWPLVKTHDLQALANELDSRQSDLVTQVKPLAIFLAEVYFTDRYLGFDLDDPDWPKLRLQLQ